MVVEVIVSVTLRGRFVMSISSKVRASVSFRFLMCALSLVAVLGLGSQAWAFERQGPGSWQGEPYCFLLDSGWHEAPILVSGAEPSLEGWDKVTSVAEGTARRLAGTVIWNENYRLIKEQEDPSGGSVKATRGDKTLNRCETLGPGSPGEKVRCRMKFVQCFRGKDGAGLSPLTGTDQ
jgi:hypothetical protein